MDRITPILEDLATCITAQLEVDGLPPTCFTGVIPGDAAVASYAGSCPDKCGMAWVRLASLYPAVSPGAADDGDNNCGASIGATVELGILRCFESTDSRGNSPGPARMLEGASLQNSDAMAIWRAVKCCSSLDDRDYSLASYTPSGPLGNMVGGAFTLFLVL